MGVRRGVFIGVIRGVFIGIISGWVTVSLGACLWE